MTSYDLNLVPVFDALLRHRSVSAAAGELHLTQPAVSNALRRLRHLTRDELFVRTRRGMEPTAYAMSAASSLGEGLRLIRDGLERSASFEPQTATRAFRILMTDAGEMVFLPRLMSRLREAAPSLCIEVRQLPIERYLEALETGQADLAIGNLRTTRGAIVTRRIFQDSYKVVCRRRHGLVRAAGRSRVAPFDMLMAAEHILVRPPNVPDSPVERTLRRNGWKRRVALEVPHYLVLGRIIGEADLVAITPSLVARELARHADIVSLAPPFEIPPVVIRLGWHQRQQQDGGSVWLRNLIAELLARP
ncbi:MAG: LysR family transcriptional regulator [Hyphomicrobiales bacterium]|nr:LysR family transcriptional regulator [Hyphomicrobiales bacterium]